VVTLAKIERLPDLTPSAIVPALARLKDDGYAPRTIEARIIAIKSFSRWAWRDGRAAEYALVGLVKPCGPMERRRVRRPLSETELRILVETTRTAPIWRGMSGLDRSMLYAVASMTGFRRGELRSFRTGTKTGGWRISTRFGTHTSRLSAKPDCPSRSTRPWRGMQTQS
jgi:site-specific recombinase XerD